MDFVEKFDEKAQEVLQAQKFHLLEVIEKLKPKSSQLWGHYDNGQWIDEDGDGNIRIGYSWRRSSEVVPTA